MTTTTSSDHSGGGSGSADSLVRFRIDDVVGTTSNTRSTDARSTDARSTDARSTDARSTDTKSTSVSSRDVFDISLEREDEDAEVQPEHGSKRRLENRVGQSYGVEVAERGRSHSSPLGSSVPPISSSTSSTCSALHFASSSMPSTSSPIPSTSYPMPCNDDEDIVEALVESMAQFADAEPDSVAGQSEQTAPPAKTTVRSDETQTCAPANLPTTPATDVLLLRSDDTRVSPPVAVRSRRGETLVDCSTLDCVPVVRDLRLELDNCRRCVVEAHAEYAEDLFQSARRLRTAYDRQVELHEGDKSTLQVTQGSDSLWALTALP